MSRPARADVRFRFNLELPASVRERAERAKVLSEAGSLTEVIRRALGVYEELLLRTDGGGRILLRVDGEDRELRWCPYYRSGNAAR